MSTELYRDLRSRRPPRPAPPEAPDPWQCPQWLWEEERTAKGTVEPALTVFLIGAECPFTCIFCDLWRITLPHATPLGALPHQLELVLEAAEAGQPRRRWRDARLKLYNASNFFEARAVPPEDDEALAHLAATFGRVVVECHPRLVLGQEERCRAFGHNLCRRGGGTLEVALGLETVHPEASLKLHKGSTPDDFRRAAAALREWGVAVRAFVLLGIPFVPPAESVEWTVRSVEAAVEAGAEHVAIIPVRGGEVAMADLARQDAFTAPSLGQLEEALARCSPLQSSTDRPGAVVTADLWDLELLSSCSACFAVRRARLSRMNLLGGEEEPVTCKVCGEGA